MYATLLLPAGVTSEASIRYKDEEKLLEELESADDVYVYKVLPQKMEYNLRILKEFGLAKDVRVIVQTLAAIMVG